MYEGTVGDCGDRIREGAATQVSAGTTWETRPDQELPGPARQVRTEPQEPLERTGRSGRLILALTAAGIVGWQWLLLHDHFFFGNDDLLQFEYGQEHGASWTTASQFVFQHFGPVNRMAHYLVLSSGLSPTLAFALVSLSFAALLAALIWVTGELGLSLSRRLFVLLGCGLSITMLETAVWFDAGMHIFPALALTWVVVASHLRAVRTGRGRWHGVATVLFALGPLTQERPLFALPLLVGADLLLLWRGQPWAQRWRQLWALRGPIAALAVLGLAAGIGLQAALLVESTTPSPTWALTGMTALVAVAGYVLPSLINLYPGLPEAPGDGAPLSTGVQFTVIVAIVLAGAALARARRGNGSPLAFAAGAVLLYYGFLKFSPILTEPNYLFNAARLNNVVYVTVPVVLALAHLRLPDLRAVRPAAGRLRAAATVVLVAVIAAAYAINAAAFASDISTSARTYVDGVRAALPVWSDPDVTVLPLFGNPELATGWAGVHGLQDRFLQLLVPGWEPADLGERPVVLDEQGQVRDVALQRLTRGDPRAAAQCAPAQDPSWMAVPLPNRVRGEPLFIQLTYTARSDTGGELHSYLRAELTANLAPIDFDAGRHTVLIPVHALAADLIALRSHDPGAGVCLESLSVVRPLLTADETGTESCSTIDYYGRARYAVPCPGG